MSTYSVIISDNRIVTYDAVADTDTDVIINASGLNPSISSPAWAQRQTKPIQSQVHVLCVANEHGKVQPGTYVITPVTPVNGSPDPPPQGTGKSYQIVVTETRTIMYSVIAADQPTLESTISQLNPYNVVFPKNVVVVAPLSQLNSRVVEIITETGKQLSFC